MRNQINHLLALAYEVPHPYVIISILLARTMWINEYSSISWVAQDACMADKPMRNTCQNWQTENK